MKIETQREYYLSFSPVVLAHRYRTQKPSKVSNYSGHPMFDSLLYMWYESNALYCHCQTQHVISMTAFAC